MRRAPLLILLTLASGCASSGAVPAPFPTPAPAATVPPASASDSRDRPAVVGTALSLRGAPYRDGGTDPSGFDCSGFVSYVFGQQGIYVARTVSEQYAQGRSVSRDAVTAGDLVFFSTVSPGASHVGIAISGTEFVHAPTSRGLVRVDSLTSTYWSSRFVGTRRIR